MGAGGGVLAEVVVDRELRRHAAGRGQQPVGVVGVGVGQHQQAAVVGLAELLQLPGVDADLLGPADQPLVDLPAQGGIVAQVRRAVQVGELAALLAALPGAEEAGGREGADSRRAARDAPPGTGDGVQGCHRSSWSCGSGPGSGDVDVLQDADGVRDEDRGRVVGGDQVPDDRLVADAHEADVQAGLVLVRDAGLVQADDALAVLAGAHREDRGGVAVRDRDLAAREDRHAAPGRDPVAVDVGAVRVDAALAALAAEGRDRLRVGQEKSVRRRIDSRSSMSSGVGGPDQVLIRWS